LAINQGISGPIQAISRGVLNTKPVSGCLYLAVFLDGAEIVTVESLATSGKLDPVQEAFIECSAFQCGYCTPDCVLMAKALLEQTTDPDDEQIRDYLAGNLCRYAAYPENINAVKMAARKIKAGPTG
jgi:aerobic carbon-monoxide dehydrogenase small subunit